MLPRRAPLCSRAGRAESILSMIERAVFFLSDQTGVTAETLGHSLIAQFAGQNFRQVTVPFIDSEDKAREAVETINSAGQQDTLKPVVFSTLVHPDLRAIVKESDGLHLDIFDAFLGVLSTEFSEQPTYASGGAHGMSDIDAYMKRIEATNFALANDDGGVSRNYDVADVILVGVSRSGKTPTCLYLALQYGVYAANYPLTDDELENGALPDYLVQQKQKLFGLTIEPQRLQQIRKERRPMGNYSSAQQVRFELREAEKIFRRYKVPFVDTTKFSIEEISSRILDSTGVERRVHP